MGQYRKKPIVIEAHQWHKDGDHSVVERYRDSDVRPESLCHICKRHMVTHGWIKTLEGGHIVCPDDWIVCGVIGEYYPVKPDIFERTYEPAANM